MNTYKNYIDLLRKILKNFDNNEFNDIIKKILRSVFDEYYLNRNDKIYYIDNLYRKFDIAKFNFIIKKYGIIKNTNLIYRFNGYSKRAYIIKLLKENFRVILEENETYESIANNILEKDNTKNYKKYIDNMFIEREIESFMIKVRKKEFDKNIFRKVDNDFMKYTNCLKFICHGHYCENHNKISLQIDCMRFTC